MSVCMVYTCDRCGSCIQGKNMLAVYVSGNYSEEVSYHFCRDCREKFEFALELATGRVRHRESGRKLDIVEVSG